VKNEAADCPSFKSVASLSNMKKIHRTEIPRKSLDAIAPRTGVLQSILKLVGSWKHVIVGRLKGYKKRQLYAPVFVILVVLMMRMKHHL
jgi:hypothetical protein